MTPVVQSPSPHALVCPIGVDQSSSGDARSRSGVASRLAVRQDDVVSPHPPSPGDGCMLPDFTAPFKRLRVTLWRPAPPPPEPPDLPCPLTHPDAPLPAWVETDPIVQKYRTLLGALPWVAFPERPADRAYPGPA